VTGSRFNGRTRTVVGRTVWPDRGTHHQIRLAPVYIPAGYTVAVVYSYHLPGYQCRRTTPWRNGFRSVRIWLRHVRFESASYLRSSREWIFRVGYPTLSAVTMDRRQERPVRPSYWLHADWITTISDFSSALTITMDFYILPVIIVVFYVVLLFLDITFKVRTLRTVVLNRSTKSKPLIYYG